MYLFLFFSFSFPFVSLFLFYSYTIHPCPRYPRQIILCKFESRVYLQWAGSGVDGVRKKKIKIKNRKQDSKKKDTTKYKIQFIFCVFIFLFVSDCVFPGPGRMLSSAAGCLFLRHGPQKTASDPLAATLGKTQSMVNRG